MKDRIFIDSNIFLYAFSDKDKDKQQVAKKIVLNPSCISVQVVNEVSKNLLYKFKFNENEIVKVVDSLYKKHIVAELTQTIFVHASNIRVIFSGSNAPVAVHNHPNGKNLLLHYPPLYL